MDTRKDGFTMDTSMDGFTMGGSTMDTRVHLFCTNDKSVQCWSEMEQFFIFLQDRIIKQILTVNNCL